MAKKALVEKNNKRSFASARSREKRMKLLSERNNKSISLEERFAIQKKINSLPRNTSRIRFKNRCSITGRPRGYYRKFGVSRLQFRLLAGCARLPGVIKSSW